MNKSIITAVLLASFAFAGYLPAQTFTSDPVLDDSLAAEVSPSDNQEEGSGAEGVPSVGDSQESTLMTERQRDILNRLDNESRNGYREQRKQDFEYVEKLLARKMAERAAKLPNADSKLPSALPQSASAVKPAAHTRLKPVLQRESSEPSSNLEALINSLIRRIEVLETEVATLKAQLKE